MSEPAADAPLETLDELYAFAPGELPEIPGGWTTRRFQLADRNFEIVLPAGPDEFLDDPDVLAANVRDDYMPYWGYLWPASLDMANAILQTEWTVSLEALEVGSGLGLAGLAAAAAGHDVTFSDYDRQAVRISLYNAAHNGFPSARGVWLDWRQPLSRRFPLILASDLIYERRNHAPLLDVLDSMLAPRGTAWFTDPDRHQSGDFVLLAKKRGFQIEQRELPRVPLPDRPPGHTYLWLLRRG